MATQGFDLAELDTASLSNEGIDVAIYHPTTKADLGISITVHGADSDVFRKAQRAQQNRRLKNMARGRNGSKLTAEELETEGLDTLVACTKSWAGVVLQGKALDCEDENVRAVYVKFPWIREQVEDAIGDRANFIKG